MVRFYVILLFISMLTGGVLLSDEVKEEVYKVIVKIGGMWGKSCEAEVESAISSLDGVKEVNASVSSRSATITFKASAKFEPSEIRKKIKDLKYSPSDIYVSDLLGNIDVKEKKVIFTSKSNQVFELVSGKVTKDKEFKINPDEFKTDEEDKKINYKVSGKVKETKVKDEEGKENVKYIIEVEKLDVMKPNGEK